MIVRKLATNIIAVLLKLDGALFSNTMAGSNMNMTRLVYAVLLGLQIYTAVEVFSKWTDTDTKASSNDMIFKGGSTADMTTVVGRSYYRDESRHRGKFEMKIKVSSITGGTDYDAHSVNIRFARTLASGYEATDCVYDITDDYNNTEGDCAGTTGSGECIIASGIQCSGTSENAPADHSLPTIYIGGGDCTPVGTRTGVISPHFPTDRDAECSDHGLCLLKSAPGTKTGGCVCELGRFGYFCEGELTNLDKVQYNDVAGQTPTNIESSTLAADVTCTGTGCASQEDPTQAELDAQTHVHVGPYPTTDDGYDDYTDLNVVTLAGVYLVISIVIIAYALLATWQQFGLARLVGGLVAQENVNSMLTYLNPIPEIALAGLSAAIVVAGIESFRWQALAKGDTALVASDDYEVKGTEEPQMLAYQRLMIVITLTVLSRTASYMRDLKASGQNFVRGFSAELISATASIVNIIYLVTILDDRTDRMKQLATPIFIAFLTFEIIYLVTVLVTRAGTLGAMVEGRGAGGGNLFDNVEFIGENTIVAACQALAVVLALYVSSRRAANLYDTTTGNGVLLAGTPFMQLGTRDDLCNFIDDSILKAPMTDADAITEEWTGQRTCFETLPLTGAATNYAHCCVKNSGGDAQWFLRGSIWLPLTICLVALVVVSADTLRTLRTTVANTAQSVVGSLDFLPNFMRAKPSAIPSRYSRIRVQTSLTST